MNQRQDGTPAPVQGGQFDFGPALPNFSLHVSFS
jgi:hypothetical protein